MAGKRKDSKGRTLPPNVSQKTDGRYIWRKSIEGKSYTVTDNDLAGLKAKIIQKEADIQNGTCRDLGKATLNQYFEKYIDLVDDLKLATKENYKNYWKWYIKDSPIGKKQLRNIHNSDIVELYKKLSEKLAYTTIQYINNILYSCLDCAVHDDKLLPSNPCDRAMAKIRKRLSPSRRSGDSARTPGKQPPARPGPGIHTSLCAEPRGCHGNDQNVPPTLKWMRPPSEPRP